MPHRASSRGDGVIKRAAGFRCHSVGESQHRERFEADSHGVRRSFAIQQRKFAGRVVRAQKILDALNGGKRGVHRWSSAAPFNPLR